MKGMCIEDLTPIAEELKRMVKESRLAPSEIAKAIGISERSLYRYLQDPGQMKLRTFKNITYVIGDTK